MAVPYEIRINAPVTGFQFPYQRAFGHPAITEQLIWSHLVCQTCNQKRILSQMSEQYTHFLQVFSQNAVSLTFCQSGRKLFPFSDTVTVCNIRMMFRTMPSFPLLIHLTAVSQRESSTFSCARRKVTVMVSTTNGSTDLRSLTVIIGHLLPELTMNLPQHPSLHHLHC